jgi:hypothetical protein
MNSFFDSMFCHFPFLVVPVSLIYGATRHESPIQVFWEAIRWLYRLLVFLGSISIFIIFLTWVA